MFISSFRCDLICLYWWLFSVGLTTHSALTLRRQLRADHQTCARRAAVVACAVADVAVVPAVHAPAIIFLVLLPAWYTSASIHLVMRLHVL